VLISCVDFYDYALLVYWRELCLAIDFYSLSFSYSICSSLSFSCFFSCFSFYFKSVKSLVTVSKALLFFSMVFFSCSARPSYSMFFYIISLCFSVSYKLALLTDSSYLLPYAKSSSYPDYFDLSSFYKFLTAVYFSSFSVLTYTVSLLHFSLIVVNS
jgi:hypothetical protein